MYKVGAFPIKALPPHRGHVLAIINAATQCETLYVVVSDHPSLTEALCRQAKLPVIDLKTRVRWLNSELNLFPHIKFVMLDETGIPIYPAGWPEWVERFEQAVPEKVDVIFGGDPNYVEEYHKYMPSYEFKLYDPARSKYPISGTEIRRNIYDHWDYVLGSARGFFAKKFLISGTESCGKTTMTRYLAKLYYTSWAEEAGRYYAAKYMGSNESVYNENDFIKIAMEQRELEDDAVRKANKVTFLDTDATVTLYYEKLFLGLESSLLKNMIDPSRYDYVLFFAPDVRWIDDGQRYNGEEKRRWELHETLLNLYKKYGFGEKIHIISGTYEERLNLCIDIVDKSMK